MPFPPAAGAASFFEGCAADCLDALLSAFASAPLEGFTLRSCESDFCDPFFFSMKFWMFSCKEAIFFSSDFEIAFPYEKNCTQKKACKRRTAVRACVVAKETVCSRFSRSAKIT